VRVSFLNPYKNEITNMNPNTGQYNDLRNWIEHNIFLNSELDMLEYIFASPCKKGSNLTNMQRIKLVAQH